MIGVSVVWADPQRQCVVELRLAEDATVADAIVAAGLVGESQIAAVGIFGRVVDRDHALADGDRVELYRPLVADPKQQRRMRARRAR